MSRGSRRRRRARNIKLKHRRKLIIKKILKNVKRTIK